MNSKSFMLIAGKIAAEQRAAVAHSASYGFDRPQISQAPAGATENHGSKINFFRPIQGLNSLLDNVPTAIAVGYYHTLLRSLVSWPTHSPIC
jgi:ABC-type microcin C transport system permease subunit YejB